nr:PAS domain-containing methyl-accepting chemotaxis protein [uncultured Cohaesibacter sp.]
MFFCDDSKAILNAFSRSQAMITFAPDGIILDANQNFLNALGYSINEIKGKHHSIFLQNRGDKDPEYLSFWPNLARGEYTSGEFLRIGKNGKEVWIQASYNPVFNRLGKVTKVVKIATDITSEKQERADIQGRLRAIGRSSAAIHFDLQGNILDANQNFLDAVGYRLEEIKGKHHSMFVDVDYSKSSAYQKFWEELAEGNYQAGEFKRIGKGGKEVWIQAAYNPILDPSDRPYKVVKIATDITEQVVERHRRANVQKKIDEQLSEIARAITSTMEQATNSATAASQTSSSVQTVAAAAEELVASIQEISRQVQTSSDISLKAVDEASHSNEIMIGLSDAAKTIGGVIELIENIANQTNLLALNATIEAARAGEAGKGFAVVAAEVKGLASQTSKATEEISQQIQSMQGTTEQAASALSNIMAIIDQVNDISTSISSAVEEQYAVTQEISNNMQRASEGVDSLTNNIQSISSATHHIDAATANVRKSSQTIAN